MAAHRTGLLTVGEATLRTSNLDKVLYPATGTTKGDVLDYYLRVAAALIPQAAWRPVTRKRWVDGVGTAADPGSSFFRKDLEASSPGWIPTGRIVHKSRTSTYPLANHAAVLAWFAQLAVLEIHVPQWRFGADGQPRNPDRLVIDLDPGPDAGLRECVEVAHTVREILTDMDLDPVPVTSGSKGIHIYAPLDGTATSSQASAVARHLAQALEEALPELVVTNQKKSLRAGKVLVDWSQNNEAKTTICPYSLRGRQHPTVAAPRTWEELDEPDLAQLDYREVLRRLDRGVDPIAAQGWDFDQAPGSGDKLTRYRAKRDARRTPEPVPASVPDRTRTSGEPSFVVQEHHATRLHWDFRLEHDGVLVSWAVPKGPPLEHTSRRLAVQTEDHPLAYGSFEGVIPKGEYGGGSVTIWDSGTYCLEKWRDDEIIVVLTGRRDGGFGGIPRRYALARTAGAAEKSQWLMLLTKDQPDPGADDAAPTPPPGRAPVDPPSPMLASPGTASDIGEGTGWAFETKWDGIRAICAVEGATVRIVSRGGNELGDRFPELNELTEALQAEAAILDGEIVALDGAGRASFELLQQRLNVTPRRARQLARTMPVTLMLFDLLALTVEGEVHSLLETPYRARRSLLETAIHPGDHIQVPPTLSGGLAAAREQARADGQEGVVAKRTGSPYRAGRRSADWIKLKDRPHQAVVVVGWHTDADGRLNSLALAVPGGEGELRYVGRVGSGIAPGDLSTMEATLHRLSRKTPPVTDPPADGRQLHWVTPRLVGEVAFGGVTAQGRLRHPVWRGWRPDLDPADVAWEQAGPTGPTASPSGRA